MSRSNSNTRAIRYPFGRGSAGAISIEDYTKGTPVACFGCDRPLVAKQGRKNRWHFAHCTDVEARCSAETALHRLSKILIREGFEAALAAGRSYVLRWTCPHCRRAREVDCTSFLSRVSIESSAVHGTRGDLVFDGQRPIAIEIVVHHELDTETAQRYASADVPVFIVRPSWATVRTLWSELSSDEAVVTRSEKCPHCRDLIREEQAHQPRVEQLRSHFDEWRLLDDRIAEARLAGWPPDRDPFGRELFPRIRSEMADWAIRLLALGFHQTPTTPWLFALDLADIGTVLALWGDTKYEPIWTNPRPSIELQLRVSGARLRYSEVIRSFLERHGDVDDDYYRDSLA